MIKDVVISIKGLQGLDGDSDTVELTTDGQMGIKDGQYYLTYEEGQLLDSGDRVKTQLFIKNNDSVVLQRSGSIKSRMVIVKGERNTCYYTTPVGELVIGIFGEEIEHSLTEKGGKLKLKYTIDSNLQIVSRNEVNISVREV
jgi:uncharacterized beta-barrel protein YwiB (DUF1934 family)